MNDLFKPVNIMDSRISHIKSSLNFGVLSGSAQNTYQAFGAISQSASTITYNIQVPSMSTVIDRNVLHQSTITLRIAGTGVALNAKFLDYENTDSLQAFPLNSLVTTQTATINNTSVTTNLQDIMPQMLRMYDNEKLQRFNSLTPAFPDEFWYNYANSVGTNSNPMSALNNAGLDIDLMPRGAYPVSMAITHNIHAGGQDASVVSTDVADTWVVLLTFTVVGPILGLAPFCHTDTNDEAGFMGINNLNLTFNLDSSCKRVFSSANAYINSISVNSVVGSQLLMNFLSLQPEQYGKIQPRNVLPYQDLSRYIYNQNVVLPNSGANGPIHAGSSYNFSNIQFNQVPDLMIICARIPMAQQTYANAYSFFTINSVSINFNNSSGILSSANQQQLYLMSVKNGSSQTFFEFCGHSQNNVNATGNVQYIPTLGSLLVLNPAMDFGLPSMYSASSGGQYNFQMTINVSNQSAVDIAPELCIMVVNSGLFVTENGTSVIHTGILTRDQVLQTKNEESHVDSSLYRRLVGGSLHNIYSLIPRMLGNHKDRKEEGSGACAGAFSAGSDSAGNMHRKVHKYK